MDDFELRCRGLISAEEYLWRLDEKIRRRRLDNEFMGRIKRSMEENREVLDRLASPRKDNS
jgi:hypothetical protein